MDASALQAVTATTFSGSDEGDADSISAGALKTLGGLGVAKKAHIGTGLTVDEGGAKITENANAAVLTVHNSIANAAATPFSEQVLLLKAGRAANTAFDFIKGEANTAVVFQVNGKGDIITTSDSEASDSESGSIRTQGGLGVKLKTHIGGELTVMDASALQAVTATTFSGTNEGDADSKTDGALKTSGGLGVAKKAHIGTGLTVDEGGATVSNGGIDATNTANAAVLKAFSKNDDQTAAVLRITAQH